MKFIKNIFILFALIIMLCSCGGTSKQNPTPNHFTLTQIMPATPTYGPSPTPVPTKTAQEIVDCIKKVEIDVFIWQQLDYLKDYAMIRARSEITACYS